MSSFPMQSSVRVCKDSTFFCGKKTRNQLIPRWPGYSSVPWTDVGAALLFLGQRVKWPQKHKVSREVAKVNLSFLLFVFLLLTKIFTLATLSLPDYIFRARI